MADANYVLLEKITVGAATASSVTFSGIPQTGYTDLKVVISSGQSAANGSNGYYYDVTFNGTSANRSGRYLIGQNGISAVSGVYTLWGVSNPNDFTANTFSNGELYIPNYTSSNFKSASLDSVNENNASTNRLNLSAGLWSDTAAINSITFTPGGGNFIQFSTFYLYGIAKLGTTPVIVPYATGGDIIDTDGTYWYHTFLSSGTFTPQKALSVDYLVVAGGGGGANSSTAGGGGGAGGYRTASGFGVSQGGSVTVTVGGGGGGAGPSGGNGSNGSNSVFSTITSTGGGGGGRDGAGLSGGSGGGGGGTAAAGGAGTSGQGNNGGASSAMSGGGYVGAGGGGGAGAVGSAGTIVDGNNTNGGAGGAGSASSITGTSVTRGGGGGGGTEQGTVTAAGGSGGGGSGGRSNSSTSPVAGTANTGGGGGGAYAAAGAAGGSGIVIVRYAV